MRIALIGASGYIGAHVRDRALQRGHDVTALVRRVARIPEAPGLVARELDVRDPVAVAEAVAGHDVVISCFHPGGHDPVADPHVYRDIVEGTRTIVEGVRCSPVRRLVYVGGCGSLLVDSGRMLVDDREFLLAHSHHGRPQGTYPLPAAEPSLDIPLAARMAYYLLERETDLRWTFVSPSRFVGDFGGRGGRVVRGTDHLLMEDGAPARVDVEDLADAVVGEAEDPEGSVRHLTVATFRT